MSGPFTFSVVVKYWGGPWDGQTVGALSAQAPVGTPVSFLESAGATGVYVMADTNGRRRAEWHPGSVMWREES